MNRGMSNSPRLMAVRMMAARIAPKRGARRAETRRPHQDRGRVRLCVYQPCWLSERPEESFAWDKEITWSTGESTQKDDVQVFCVSGSFARHRWPDDFQDDYDSIKEDLKGDQRLGAVHSL